MKIRVVRGAVLIAVIFIMGANFRVYAGPMNDYTSKSYAELAEEYYQLLLRGDFNEVEDALLYARDLSRKSADGQPILGAFYLGVGGCVKYLCDRLSENEWADKLALLYKWKRDYPSSVAAHLSIVLHHIGHGWSVRGSGYRKTVSPHQWDVFHKKVNAAFVLLGEVGDKAKQDPAWFEAMLSIGLAQQWEEARYSRIYHEGIALYPAYLPIHFWASAYFSPRWYGSVEKLNKFVTDAVDNRNTKKAIGDGSLYARIHGNLWTNKMFMNGQTVWFTMKESFRQMIDFYPTRWNINNFAKFSCIAGDGSVIVKYEKTLKQSPMLDAWMNDADYKSNCIDWAIDNKSYWLQQ